MPRPHVWRRYDREPIGSSGSIVTTCVGGAGVLRTAVLISSWRRRTTTRTKDHVVLKVLRRTPTVGKRAKQGGCDCLRISLHELVKHVRRDVQRPHVVLVDAGDEVDSCGVEPLVEQFGRH